MLTAINAFIRKGCSPLAGVRPRSRYSATARTLFSSSSLRLSAPSW